MELSQYGELFLSESREHIGAINHLLLALEADPSAAEAVEGVFRAVHTIKGMSATMGFGTVAELAHELENLLDGVRRGMRALDPDTVDLLFAATDALEHAVESAVGEEDEGGEAESLIARLRGAGAVSAPAPAQPPEPRDRPRDRGVATDGLAVRVTVDGSSALPGVRAFLVLRRARMLGEVSGVVPPEETLQGEGFTGTLEFRLRGTQSAEEVRALLWGVGELESVAVTDRGAVARDVARAPHASPGAEAPRARHIRVDLRRLDSLMNQVGELVILRDRLQRIVVAHPAPEVSEAVDQASRLISELQNEIVQARMVPVWQVFDRFPRLVRDAACALDKQVDFQIDGKQIEFDRSVLDEIGDPLVHLLRNALDHGIESPEERLTAGKPATGTLRLSASRERSRALIRVEDDGGGIRRERVLARAVAVGLVDPREAETLPDDQVLRLILCPGFSTAERVTDVSGRGVGLDVVATRVRALGGTLDIASTEGKGTAFTIRLPLTLAILRALVVGLGSESYAIPLAHVGETLEIERSGVRRVNGSPVILVRDEAIPLLRLRSILGSGDPASSPEPLSVVVLEVGEQRIGLEVDSLLGQREIVVKAFDAAAGMFRAFSGATILSDGRPALILDAGSLAARA